MSGGRGQSFVSFMSRHLVPLTGKYESYEKSGRLHHKGTFIVSGFIIALQERWFWVSAGHCLNTLDESMEAGHLAVFATGFADFCGPDAQHFHTVPFEYSPGTHFRIEKEALGIDYALIPIPNLLRANFERNGVVPISRVNWIHQAGLTFSDYKLLGCPSELIRESDNPDAKVSAYFQTALITVERIQPGQVEGVQGEVWFAGQIVPEETIQSIEGMSGGPIFGFRQREDDRWTYHAVALQSWWDKDSRIIHGCSLPLFAEAVQEVLNSSHNRAEA